MKRILQLVLILFMILITSCSHKEKYNSINNSSTSSNIITNENDSSNLIVYFSYSGNTEKVAKSLNNKIESKLVKIMPSNPYTKEDVDYTNSSSRSQKERKDDARPSILDDTYNSYNLESINNIFIGFPIWNGYCPMIIKTYIEHEYEKLLNKKIFTFSTSSSSSGSSSFNELKNKYKDLNFEDYLHLTSSKLKNIDNEVNNKISSWNLNKKEDNRKISIIFDDFKIGANLVDNNPSNDLIKIIEKDSITLTFNDFKNSEKIAFFSLNLNLEGEKGYDPQVGDIVIYKPWNNIAIFYEDSVSFSSDLIYLGTIKKEYIYLIEKIKDNSQAIIKMEGK